jgi:beta-lactam-binding protein with PASTA domain
MLQTIKKTAGNAANDKATFFWRLWNNFYVRNIIFAVSTIILLLLVMNLWLMIYTRHGQTFETPNFVGLSLSDARRLAHSKRLRIEVNDSVFIAHKMPGSVIEQHPKPKVRVKNNRNIFLTLNASSAKKMHMPNVVGSSLRQAKATIEMQGFEVGRLSFAPDMASGNVLSQLYRGRKVQPNELLTVGSKIDLVLGRSYSSERTALPQLKGLSLTSAKSNIIEAALNVGKIMFDESIVNMVDSLEAKVYAQYPAAVENAELEVGSSVDIYLTVNAARIGQ